MAKNAVVLVDHDEDGISRVKGDLIRNMAPNQFADFEAVGLVRGATAEDLAPAAPSTPAPAKSKTKA